MLSRARAAAVNAVSSILKRYGQREQTRDVFEEKWSVSEKIELVANLLKERQRLKFSELFEDATSRAEVVVTFLALLELIRMKQLRIEQTEAFAEIEISPALPPPPIPREDENASAINETAEAPTTEAK